MYSGKLVFAQVMESPADAHLPSRREPIWRQPLGLASAIPGGRLRAGRGGPAARTCGQRFARRVRRAGGGNYLANFSDT